VEWPSLPVVLPTLASRFALSLLLTPLVLSPAESLPTFQSTTTLASQFALFLLLTPLVLLSPRVSSLLLSFTTLSLAESTLMLLLS
jgi:hypothetical protein